MAKSVKVEKEAFDAALGKMLNTRPAPLSHPRQRSWGAGWRKAGPDGIGGNRQPRMRVGLMNLVGGPRRPGDDERSEHVIDNR